MGSDRLRRAADELVSWANSEGDWELEVSSSSQHWRAEAALLRQIAQIHDAHRAGEKVFVLDIVAAADLLSCLVLGERK